MSRAGDWLYGFAEANPENQGLFPLSFVDLRPVGALVDGCLESEQWDQLNGILLSFKKGDMVVREHDAAQAGHLFFLRSGSLSVLRGERVVASLGPGEIIGG